MGFNELSIIDGPCDDAPCAPLPACGSGGVICISEGDDAIFAPTSLSFHANFTLSEELIEEYGSYTEEGGSTTIHLDAEGEFGCRIAGDEVVADRGSFGEDVDNRAYDVITGASLNVALTNYFTSGNCCTFNYATPVLDGGPSVPWVGGGTLPLTTAVSNESIQVIGSFPAGTVTIPSIIGDLGDCTFGEICPAVECGFGPIFATASLSVTVCRSPCDNSWHGSVVVDFQYFFYEFVGCCEGITGVNAVGMVLAGAAPTVYWHLPNTGTKSNASGEFGASSVYGNIGPDGEASPGDYDIFFTLSMQGDNPCPPDGNKVPTQANELTVDLNGTVVNRPLLSWHKGNFTPLRIYLIENNTAGVTAIHDIELAEINDGFEGYILPVYMPFTSGVTTVDDVLDVINASDRFNVSDRDNTSQIIDWSGTGVVFGHYHAIGQGATTGGDGGTPVPGSSVLTSAVSQVASDGPHAANSKAPGLSIRVFYVPNYCNSVTPPDYHGILLVSYTDGFVVAPGCPLEGFCAATAVTTHTFDQVLYGMGADGCTWNLD